MNNSIRTIDLFDCSVPYLKDFFNLFEYPWQMLPKLKDHILKLIDEGIDGFTLISDGVLVGKDVKIHKSAIIDGPCILGHGTEVRPSAYIRGSVITGERCVLGNSSEFKNCILLDNVQTPHYNYVGDSILGNGSHMGAGAVCSNLKSDKRSIVIHGSTPIDTGLRKIGGILADGADIGCGSVLNPGTVVGKRTSVYPMTALRGVYPMDSIVKSADNVVKRENK